MKLGIDEIAALMLAANSPWRPEALAELIVDTARAATRVAVDRQNFLTEEFSRRMRELQHAALTRWDGTTFERDRS